jgi:hypothetical protein
MEQYIPKSIVVAELERINKSIGCDRFLSEYEKGCNQGKEEVCDTLRNFLDTLEIKEVSLDDALSSLDEDIKEFITTKEFENESALSGRYWAIAKHAFLLGLKAQKGE